MNKKCGILTITIPLMNYGNRLQNYALRKSLVKLGYDVSTIHYSPTYEISSTNKPKNGKINISDFRTFAYTINRKINGKVLEKRNNKEWIEKEKKFKAFTENYLNYTTEIYSLQSNMEDLEQKFDYFICGSDQVWNPDWEGSNPIYYMGFAPIYKRVVYAASFGVSTLSDAKKQFVAPLIKDIQHLSCREDTGVKLVKELTGKEAVQVLDPVFLLSAEEWRQFSVAPKNSNIHSKYILVYFLGQISLQYYKQIKKYSKELGCKVIFLDSKRDINSIFASPEEFVYLINNAELICTDSFHGCAFSLVLNKNFIYFERSVSEKWEKPMNTRIQSLFNVFSINRNSKEVSDTEIVNMNYSKINSIIEEERRKSLQYLKQALNSKEL